MMDLKQEMKERCAYIEQALEQAVPEQKQCATAFWQGASVCAR